MKRTSLITVLVLTCTCIWTPSAFAESTTTVADGIVNLIRFVKGITGFLWNLRLVLGLFILIGSVIYWFNQNQKGGDKTILVPIVGLFGGAFLTVSGGIDLGANLLTIDKTVGGVHVAGATDNRVNMVSATQYTTLTTEQLQTIINQANQANQANQQQESADEQLDINIQQGEQDMADILDPGETN